MELLWQKMSAAAFDKMRTTVNDIVAEGYPMSALLSQLHDDVINHTGLADVDKALICEKIAQAEQYLLDGSNESLQLADVAAFIMRCFTKQALPLDTARH
jgi:replication factor C subunit 2/4